MTCTTQHPQVVNVYTHESHMQKKDVDQSRSCRVRLSWFKANVSQTSASGLGAALGNQKNHRPTHNMCVWTLRYSPLAVALFRRSGLAHSTNMAEGLFLKTCLPFRASIAAVAAACVVNSTMPQPLLSLDVAHCLYNLMFVTSPYCRNTVRSSLSETTGGHLAKNRAVLVL